MVTDGNWTYCDDHFIAYVDLNHGCTPETNILLFVNNSVKKKYCWPFRHSPMCGLFGKVIDP